MAEEAPKKPRPIGWLRSNAKSNAALKAELGNKGWIEGRIINPDGSIGGRRIFAEPEMMPALRIGVVVGVEWQGLNAIRRLLIAAAQKSPDAVSKALNRTAETARTETTRALVVQTGLKYGRLRKSMSLIRSSASTLTAEIRARGGYTSLKEFNPRQTKAGVSAAPWGRRQVFDHTFIVKRYGGHVYKRLGAARFPLGKLYGPSIPVELVKGASAAAFRRVVETELPKRLDHELGRLFKA